MSSTQITNFPQEILVKICRCIDRKSLLDFACCSKTCYNSIGHLLFEKIKIDWLQIETTHELPSLKHLKFANCLTFSGDHYHNRLPEWDDVSINFRRIIDHCNPNNLINFRIEHRSMKDKDMTFALEKFCNLQKLTVECCFEISIFSLKGLYNLKHLKKLSLACSFLEDMDFSQLHLEVLCLFKCYRVNNNTLGQIACIDCLKKLTFSYNGDLWNGDIPTIHIGQLEKLVLLEELDIGYTKISSEREFYTLSKSLTSLKMLDITEIKISSSLKDICYMSSLHHLDMTACGICDEQISLLQSLKTLRYLDLGCNDITDTGMRNIGKLVSLYHLKIQDCEEITDEGILYLSPLILLVSIDIAGCVKLTNGCLIYLTKLSSLKEITCYDTNITDNALEQMKIFMKDWQYL